MEITLTSKDADFILKFIRAELVRLNDSALKLNHRQKELEAVYKDMKKSDYGDTIVQLAKEVSTCVSDNMNEVRRDLERCIELLTIGSYQ